MNYRFSEDCRLSSRTRTLRAIHLQILCLTEACQGIVGALLLGLLSSTYVFAQETPQSGNSDQTPWPPVVADVKVNWDSGEVTLLAAPPEGKPQDGYQLRLSRKRLAGADAPRFRHTDDGRVSVRGSSAAILATLTPETRSLWFHHKSIGKALRVDLPPVRLYGLSTKRDDRAEDSLLLNLIVEGLLPGFRVYVQTQIGDEESKGPIRLVETNLASIPRLVATSLTQQDRAKVRLLLPAHAADSTHVHYYFTLVNADGSHSRPIRVTHNGDSLDKRARSAGPPRPMPVDSDVTVPNVELMSVAEAKEALENSRLTPLFVDEDSLREVQPDQVREELVVQQGLAPGTMVKAGEMLLLAVSSVSSPTVEIDPSILSANASLSAIDVGDALGFVSPVRPEDEFVGASGPSVADIASGHIDELESNDSQAGEPAVDFADTGGIAIPLDSDPGFNINPQTGDQNQQLGAAVLKLVLQSLADRIEGAEFEEGIGKAIQSALEAEPEILRALAKKGNVETIPADQVLTTVLEELDVSLSSDQRSQAINQWRESARNRANAYLLDRNRNQHVSDDIAVWFITWLYSHQLFDPRPQVTVTGSALGTPAAVLGRSAASNQANSADWVRNLAGLIRLGEGISKRSGSSARASSGGNASTGTRKRDATSGGISVSEETIAVKLPPKGPAKVTEGSTPDKVRVPPMKDKGIRDAVALLQRVNLRPSGRFYSSDIVIDSKPSERVWISPGNKVDLTVKRKVPELRKKTFKEAVEITRQRRFKIRVRRGYQDTDIILKQDPEPGPNAYLNLGDPITLTLQRRIPDVVGLDVPSAKQELAAAGFRAVHYPDYGAKDTVYRQSPEPGDVTDLQAEVELTLKRPIPSLKGMRLDEAKRNLEEHKLNSEVTVSTSGIQDVYVYDQSPPGNKALLISPNKTSAGQPLVKLTPGTRVPPLSGKTIEEARRELKPLRLELSIRNENSITSNSTYRITRQITRTRRLVALDSSVEVEVGADKVRVPPVTNITVAEARERLDDSGLDWDFRIRNARDNDRVTDQDPRTGKRVDPGSKVLLDPLERYLPDKTRASWNGAVKELESLGFDVNSSGTGDVVYSQSPRGDRYVEIGQLVTLVPGVRVPSGLVGKDLDSAFSELRGKGLFPISGTTSTRPTTNSAQGGRTEVTSLDPIPGTIVERGSEVSVASVEYEYRDPDVRIPPWKGRPCRDVVNDLSQLGLVVRLYHTKQTTRDRTQLNQHLVNSVTVDSRVVPAYTPVAKGSVVIVSCTVYVGEDLRRVPNIKSHGVDFVIQVEPAINVVKKSGFTPMIVYRGATYNETTWAALAVASAFSAPPGVRDDLRHWKVNNIYKLWFKDQRPLAGTRKPVGSQVYIYVKDTSGFR